MEKIINNPGFQHLTENVFLNLDVDVLKICGQINKSCEQILKKPMFWLRKFRCLSKESQKDWVNIIQSVKNSDYEIVIICYLQWKLKKEVVEVVDLPYIWFKKFRSLPQENQNNWILIRKKLSCLIYNGSWREKPFFLTMPVLLSKISSGKAIFGHTAVVSYRNCQNYNFNISL